MGKFIRKYKLDELPQLINVLKGEMSLVGPRPQVAEDVDLYTKEEKIILSVRPGITDWASIKFHNEGEILRASQDADQAYMEKIRPKKIMLELLGFYLGFNEGLIFKPILEKYKNNFIRKEKLISTMPPEAVDNFSR